MTNLPEVDYNYIKAQEQNLNIEESISFKMKLTSDQGETKFISVSHEDVEKFFKILKKED